MTEILALPDIAGWQTLEFDPVRPRWIDRMQGRKTESTIAFQPWWRATYRAPFVDRRDYGRLDAFMMRAGDMGEVFRGHDPERPRPMAHDAGVPLSGVRAGGGAFDGTATLAAIASATGVMITGLPALFELREGDYVEFRMAPLLVSLHRIVADATADAEGAVTLAIRYGLDLEHFTTAALVNFEKPSCLMQIEAGTWQGNKGHFQRNPSFDAAEAFPGIEEAP